MVATAPPRWPRRWQRTRWRIGGGFFVLALLLFAAVALGSGEAVRRLADRDSRAMLSAIAGQLVRSLADGQAERLREIETLSTLEDLLDEPIPLPRWRELLGRLQRSLPHYSWIGITDTRGQVRVATGGLLEGRMVAQRPWFRDGLHGAAMGDVHDALLLRSLLPPDPNGEPLRLLDFTAPLRRNGITAGVIGAHLSLAWAEDQRRAVQQGLDRGRAIELLVFDGAGNRVLGPADPAPPPLGGEDGLRRWGDGQLYQTVTLKAQPEPGRPGLGWSVVARQPEALALSEGERLRRGIALAGAVAAALFGLAGWALAGRFTRPWVQLASDAAAAMPGRRREPADGQDEVHQLASSLGELLATLRQREQSLAQLNSRLESMVAQRTEALQRTNDDLRGFSRSVSHDLRGPLGSVAMVLRQLETGRAAPGEGQVEVPRRTVALLAGECERLALLCDELLMLAMVEQRPLEPEAVHMQALAQAVVDGLRQAPDGGAARAAQIDLSALEAVPPLRGDPVLLRQVWQNLIGNAVKFSAKAKAPRVVVLAEPPRAGEPGWHFSVADNGAGFEMSQAHRLFGVFQRLHRNSDFAGSGVGLSIVRRVVHRHGGRAWAEGEPGRGACFHFTVGTLPGAAGPAPEAATGAPQAQ